MNTLAPIPTPWKQRLQDVRQGPLTLLVWLSALVVLAWVLLVPAPHSDHLGQALAHRHVVSAPATNLVREVRVSLYQEIQAGEVVAVLDDAPLRAQAAVLSATIARLLAEVDSLRVQLAAERMAGVADWQVDLRRFQAEEEQRRLEALDLKVRLEADRIEEQRLALELDRAERLIADDLLDRASFDDIRLQREIVAARIRERTALLAQVEALGRTSRERLDQFTAQTPQFAPMDQRLRPLSEAVREQEARVEELQVHRLRTVLTAPVDGQVCQLLVRAGQAVVAGEAILTITGRSVSEIVFYVAEHLAGTIRPGSPVRLEGASRAGVTIETVVHRVGPAVEITPERLWANPMVPEYGQPVVILATPGMNFLPGERVRARVSAGSGE